NLYHTVSKHHHGHINRMVIDQRVLAPNEVYLLGVLFTRYNILFEYCDERGDLQLFPYDLTDITPVM
ncbi:unnamed protein product, partial [Didymodactylos carnosus]